MLGEKTRILVSQVKKIRTFEVYSEIEALLLENCYIKKYKPKYNIKLTDGKAYPLIRITIRDKYPKVLISRKSDDNPPTGGSIYFGPFPNSSAVKLVLKIIRKIFPYQSVLNHPKKICLYYHLGLCPCPQTISPEEYRQNIKHLISFLNGKTKKTLNDLEKERNDFSKKEEFEKSALIQKKIDGIKFVTNPVYNTFDYRTNPNLPQDTSDKQIEYLKNTLAQNFVNVKKLNRIECYDISNISGKQAVGSMVVLTNGNIDSSLYRRFKIKNFYEGPNDFAMIKEVLQRRLNHKEWKYPDLIIVDGGKGQISSALMALEEKNVFIPLIGIAKREETIITSDFKEINLSRNSEALKLVMKIRDEAHRFAITYHRKLRSKAFIFN